MKKQIIILLSGLLLFIPTVAKAHCPLCTIGAGTLAVGATYLGVSTMAVGVFIGAFALALGLWMARLAKKWKQVILYQSTIITILVVVSTVVPMLPLVSEYMSINIYWFGPYGNIFNRTYLIHNFLMGSIIGAVIMLVSPYISSWIKKRQNGKIIPYQGIVITLTLLVLVSLVIQFGL
ncbi:MAG: hypothetical protein COX81_03780 [Candidatus Magasanikbacteria bacterium CG_4_10_14_0_2_um_filter_37_12]|uniref:Cytochrome C biogenesis protein transmembrane domain-containing protein n=1 Tax=Candidatus Magasanikbacteria bacterium CG_4_10_14_0_2_um_filter_37_12 TaxID=1974637 RepID=A0A2M7V6M2_9BACT|nr:MAG: hypothetical protein COX81_03780 [Candidatus Magasanikbacteria bacterium CG_4_10_14_0_2_um_filter_37_12]